MTGEQFLVSLAESVDRRREEINLIQRVVANQVGTVLEQSVSIMALPVLYAHWEGFVKESVSEYIEFLEGQNLVARFAHPTVFSFAMKKHLTALKLSGSIERSTEFATWLVQNMASPIRFEDKKVSTGGNLSFNNLKELCDSLKIDVGILGDEKRKIDALVNRRNNIAHTGRPPNRTAIDVNDDVVLVLELIAKFESILSICVETETYKLT